MVTERSLPDRTRGQHDELQPGEPQPTETPDMEKFINELVFDIGDIKNFHPLSTSDMRHYDLQQYESVRYGMMADMPFDQFTQQQKVDWRLADRLLYYSRTGRESMRLSLIYKLFSTWAKPLIDLCEKRQRLETVPPKDTAQIVETAGGEVSKLTRKIATESHDWIMTNHVHTAVRTRDAVEELRNRLDEWFQFYNHFDPEFSWWVDRPWEYLRDRLGAYLEELETQFLVGKDWTAFLVEPVARPGLHNAMRFEMIAHSIDELIEIGEREYAKCLEEMKGPTAQLDCKTWKEAVEHVKKSYAPPGKQVEIVRDLANEAVEYVDSKHNMITIPKVARDYWRAFMMLPERQKEAPFFLGGNDIFISYPHADMSHKQKMASLRANSPAFSRSTVLHELLPGHHLQHYYKLRSSPHRGKLADMTSNEPFWTEGWAFYWELLLYDRGYQANVSQPHATNAAENAIGMLFWRLHRAARIIFSLKYHLGQMTAEECVDFLVERVGHERDAAVGEVRRSFSGEFSPLYQCAYMIGALQFYELRKELVDRPWKGGSKPKMTEKEFHDRVMQEGAMPVELLRALLTDGEIRGNDRTPYWRFYSRYSLVDKNGVVLAR